MEISSHGNHKGRDYSTVTFAAPVVINGKRGNMAVVVKRTNDNYYKMHRILIPDGSTYVLEDSKNAEPTPERGLTQKSTHANPISSASDTGVPQTGRTVKPESSTDSRKFSQRDSSAKEQKQEGWGEETHLHNMTRVQRAITSVAKGIKSKTGMKGDARELARKLETAYADIARKKAPTIQDITDAIEPVAQWIMEKTPKTLDPYAEEVLGDMKNRVIKLNAGQKAEIVSRFGSMEAFRKAIGSAIVIREKDGIPLDTFFEEMAETHPSVFDTSISDAQMGVELVDIIGTLRNMESTEGQISIHAHVD